MTNITLGDITPPRGMLISIKQGKEYTRKRILELKKEGRITKEQAEELIEWWCKEE